MTGRKTMYSGSMNALDKRNRLRGTGSEPGSASGKANIIYCPVLAQDVRSSSFKWVRGGSAYTIRGANLQHKGDGGSGAPGAYHGPVIGDLVMSPHSGKFFYEIRINCENFRVGVCSENAFTVEGSLETTELGAVGPLPNAGDDSERALTSGNYAMVDSTDNPDEAVESVVAIFHGQGSKVVVNGKELKQLWRTVIPAAGVLLSFIVDTDFGVVQLFVDKKYAGLLFDPSCNLKGKSLVPCCSLGGLEENNRFLPKGHCCAVVSPPHKFDCLY